MVDLKIFSDHSTKTKEVVTIDYPKESESIGSGNYTFRISTSFKTTKVEVSVNGAYWSPCRNAMGFWWYDWNNAGNKNYTLQARAYNSKGVPVNSTARNFKSKGSKS